MTSYCLPSKCSRHTGMQSPGTNTSLLTNCAFFITYTWFHDADNIGSQDMTLCERLPIGIALLLSAIQISQASSRLAVETITDQCIVYGWRSAEVESLANMKRGWIHFSLNPSFFNGALDFRVTGKLSLYWCNPPFRSRHHLRRLA